MKTITTLVGILLIVLGVATFAYQGFSYTKQEKLAQIGNVEVTANTEKKVYFPPLLGGLSLVAGVALVIFTRRYWK